MENEKKNQSPQGENHSHKNNRRRHGYFIEPPTGKQEQTRANDSKPSDAQKKSEPAERKAENKGENKNQAPAQGNSSHHSHRNGRHRGRHHGKPQGKSPETAENKPQQEQKKSVTEQHNEPSRSAGNQNKGNKNARNDGHGERNRQKNNQSNQGNQNNQGNHNHANKSHRSSDVLTPMPVESKRSLRVEPDNEYEEVRLPDYDEPMDAPIPESDEPVAMVEVVGIRFKNSGKTYYFAPGEYTVKKGEYAIVETARGREYGEVSLGNTMVKETDTVPPLRPIIRIATEADREHHKENKRLEEDAFRICNEKILAHGLDMKLIDAQYTFDNSKLLFYFTSAGRVDFRVLVKDLASVFRTRIELRQIGIRDEAKLMGGLGMCGRPLCCSLFLSDFGQVSIKMAKEQNLSLNSAKISGICGRLMCCLRYEHKTYEYEIKRTPPVDSVVRTVDGNGTVTEMNPLAGTVKVRLLASPEVAPKVYKREDVILLQKKKQNNPDNKNDKDDNQSNS